MENFIIALTKGRILQDSLPLLAKAGIEPVEDIGKSRKLIFDTNQSHIKLVVLRGSDVCTYVEFGAADVGIAGKDTLMEHNGNGIYEPLDLGIARCRLMTAGKTGEATSAGRIKVATKYVNIAKQYYATLGRQADMIKLYGAMELAPLMSLADEIVDIVDTGNTLKANGLEPRELIANISSRLIVNKASMKTKHRAINHLIDQLSQALG